MIRGRDVDSRDAGNRDRDNLNLKAEVDDITETAHPVRSKSVEHHDRNLRGVCKAYVLTCTLRGLGYHSVMHRYTPLLEATFTL